MNEQNQQELAAIDAHAEGILSRVMQLSDIDEATLALIEPDLDACMETMAIAGELTDMAEFVQAEEQFAAAQPASEKPAEPAKSGNAFFNFIEELFAGIPQIAATVNLIPNDPKIAAKDAPEPEGNCCVDVEEPCMAKDNAQPADQSQKALKSDKKLPLPEEPQITICIAPSTSEYFKDKKPADSKDEKSADADKGTGKLRPVSMDDQLGLNDGLGDADADGGMCVEDENGAYTCIIVPSHKDLASSLLKGARRMLGFSDRALTNAESKLPKKSDSDKDADKK